MKHNYFMTLDRFEMWENMLSEKDNVDKEYLRQNHKDQIIDSFSIILDNPILTIKEFYVFKLKVTDKGSFKVLCNYNKFNYKHIDLICNLENIDVMEDEHFDFSLNKPFKCCGHKLNIKVMPDSFKRNILYSSFIKDDMNIYDKIKMFELLNHVMNIYEINIFKKIYHYFF